MALARVVTFDGVSKDRMQEMQSEMEGGECGVGEICSFAVSSFRLLRPAWSRPADGRWTLGEHGPAKPGTHGATGPRPLPF